MHWKYYSEDQNTESKILMDGLTTNSPPELLPLARSWLTPPAVTVKGGAYRSDGYDPAQRAYVLTRTNERGPAPIDLTFAASESSPLVNPAIEVRNWGGAGVRLRGDGRLVARGREFRAGHVEHLEQTDLVIWLQKKTNQPLEIELRPVPPAD